MVRRETRPLTDRDPEAVAELAGSLVDEFARDHPRLAGIGVGVGGRVRDRSVVAESQFLGWHEVPFAELLERRTELPIVVENDVAALVEAETWFGPAADSTGSPCSRLGAGIGYGLVIGGTPVRSADEGYGLGRHWIIDPAGPLTPEGQRGSAVSMLSIPGIEYQVHAATGTRIPYETILELARSGEPLASRVITEAGRALGMLLANIANFALPEKVLLAGEGVGLMDAAADTVSESLAAHRHPQPARSTWKPRSPTSTTGPAAPRYWPSRSSSWGRGRPDGVTGRLPVSSPSGIDSSHGLHVGPRMIHRMSTTRRPAPFATKRTADEVNEEIRALWLRSGGTLSGEQRREYQRLVLEWAAASARPHAHTDSSKAA